MTATTPDEFDQRDLEVIVPGLVPVTVDGRPCTVKRLRAREAFALARVLTAGAAGAILDSDIDWTDPEDVKGNLYGMALVAIPQASDEALVFLRELVMPTNPDDAGAVRQSMTNPDLGDLLDIAAAVVEQEGDGLLELVGKARRLGASMGKLMQDRQQPKKTGGKPGRGRGRSTSSSPSTGGPTSSS